MAQKQNPQQLRTQTKYNYQENRVTPTLLNHHQSISLIQKGIQGQNHSEKQ